MSAEFWKQITIGRVDYDYFVSTHGRVKNRQGHILKPWKRGQRKGTYYAVRLFKQGRKQLTIDIQRLVAIMFLPNPKLKPEVHHVDGDPFNNTVENLAWTTRKENEAYKLFMNAHRDLVGDELAM